jgi:hypothetical protein
MAPKRRFRPALAKIWRGWGWGGDLWWSPVAVHGGAILSVGTCRQWLGMVVGATDSRSGEHQGNGAFLEEVAC